LVPGHSLLQLSHYPFSTTEYSLTDCTTQKFVARKARKYLAQSDRLLLPSLELAYVFHAIAHAPREVIAHEMIPAVRDALEELGLSLSSEGGNSKEKEREKERQKLQTRSGYWDDVCLARFLEGVCWRFVAYPVRVFLCVSPLGICTSPLFFSAVC
jgi:hypothetical protein